MTTPSEALVEGGAERRLHPWSWLFVLIQQVKSFALPLLVLLFGGRGNSWELWGLVGACVLVLVSLGQYFTYRFRVDSDGIVIRSGLFQKSLRNIPFTRIHNVALHQTVLHRVFGVAEVKLESAGGVTPEGQMRVLSLADAHALEELVRIHGKAQGSAGAAAAEAGDASSVLLSLPTSEVIRLGLISNRGMIVVAAAFGLVAQTSGEMLGDALSGSAKSLMGLGKDMHLGLVGTVVGGLALVVMLLLCGGVGALLGRMRWRRTTWQLDHRGLHVRRGLVWRKDVLVPRSRVQHLDLERGPIERHFGLATLVAHTAGTRLSALRQSGFLDEDAVTLRDALLPEPDTDDAL